MGRFLVKLEFAHMIIMEADTQPEAVRKAIDTIKDHSITNLEVSPSYSLVGVVHKETEELENNEIIKGGEIYK